MTDRGVYVCRAKHPLKIQDSRPAVLTVEGKKKIIMGHNIECLKATSCCPLVTVVIK